MSTLISPLVVFNGDKGLRWGGVSENEVNRNAGNRRRVCKE